jgi:hypothetical protein
VTEVEAIQKDLRLLTKTISYLKVASGEPGFNRALALTQLLSQFYTGFESCLEKTLKLAKIAAPAKSASQHRKILDQAIASKLVPDHCVDFLDDLLTFRHFGRHAYGIELRGNEILEKAMLTERFWPDLQARIKGFLPPASAEGPLKDAVAVIQAQGEISHKAASPPVVHSSKSTPDNDPSLKVAPPKDPNLP